MGRGSGSSRSNKSGGGENPLTALYRERDEIRNRGSQLLKEADELRRIRPRPLKKLFKTIEPTAKQKADYDLEVKTWNKQYRANQKAYKEHVTKSNEIFYKIRALEKQ